MITESSTARQIREGIIADTKTFLNGLESGASNGQLRTILQQIREKEIGLLKEGGNMLDPKIWTILLNRLAQQNGPEVIDNTNPLFAHPRSDPGSPGSSPGLEKLA